MTDTAKLTSRFQLSIPKDIREARNWQPGQEFTFVDNGHGVMIIPVPKLEDLRGLMPDANPEGYRDRDDRY